MPGDFSRKTFIPHKHYSGVLMQQGRVQLDADWNEQQAIHQHRTETEALDVIGPCGVPRASDGFKIGQTPDSTDLTISPGRIYVDGLLCELEATPVSIIGFVQNNPTQAILQTLSVDGRPLQVGQWVEIWADDEPTKILFQIVEVDPEQNILTFQNDITAYQSSTAPKLRRATTYMTQPDYPNPTPLSPLASPPTSPPGEGTYLVFLDVWQRHITVHDDPHIREVALGGPDTTTRVKNVWQVHLLPVSTETTSPPMSPPRSEVTCHTPFAEWDQHTAPSTGTLNARTVIVEDPENACLMPLSSGYRRLENQLYRVEVHTGGTRDQATFKWSRDNASVETTIELIAGDKVTVTDIGKDDVLGFAEGQWVEIVDDESELKGSPHPLLQIEQVNRATREITMQQSVPALGGGTHLKLRRWDQTGPEATTDGVKIVPGWIDLEDGVQVLFSEGFYHPGDYWLVPARTVTGEIEWPPFEISNQQPIPQPPLGIRHHYCRLAFLEVQDGTLSLMDCRTPFPPLTELTNFCYIGGGGQEAMPGERLPCPLQVAVMHGQSPVVGARVSFAITAGSGGTLQAGADSGTSLTVETDSAGVAQCEWELSGLDTDEGGRCLQVEARRIDAAGELADPPIRFNANLSIASQVAYDPRQCRDLAAAGVRTVQNAIDRLCQQTPATNVSSGRVIFESMRGLGEIRQSPPINHGLQEEHIAFVLALEFGSEDPQVRNGFRVMGDTAYFPPLPEEGPLMWAVHTNETPDQFVIYLQDRRPFGRTENAPGEVSFIVRWWAIPKTLERGDIRAPRPPTEPEVPFPEDFIVGRIAVRPGLRIEYLADELEVQAEVLKVPLDKLLEAGRIRIDEAGRYYPQY
jgi:hypothetical protein